MPGARSCPPASSISTPTTTRRSPGILAHPVLVPRGHHGGHGQLRLLHRPHPRRRRVAPAHPPPRRGHAPRHARGWRGLDDFETYPQYLHTVASRGTAINYGGYVGHTPVRLYVMGDDAYERAATADEIARMRRWSTMLAGGAAAFARAPGPPRRQRPAGAVPGGRPGRAARPARTGEAVRARCGGTAARGSVLQRGGLPPSTRGGPPVHLDGAADGEGLSLPREGDRRARRRLGRRGRGVAAGVVSAARVPDEPLRAVHAQHAPHLRQADGQVEGGRRRLPGSDLARRRPGRTSAARRVVSRSTGPPSRWPSHARTRSSPTTRWLYSPRSGAARPST